MVQAVTPLHHYAAAVHHRDRLDVTERPMAPRGVELKDGNTAACRARRRRLAAALPVRFSTAAKAAGATAPATASRRIALPRRQPATDPRGAVGSPCLSTNRPVQPLGNLRRRCRRPQPNELADFLVGPVAHDGNPARGKRLDLGVASAQHRRRFAMLAIKAVA